MRHLSKYLQIMQYQWLVVRKTKIIRSYKFEFKTIQISLSFLISYVLPFNYGIRIIKGQNIINYSVLIHNLTVVVLT